MGLVYEERVDFQPVGDSPLKFSQCGLCLSCSAPLPPPENEHKHRESCSGQRHHDSDVIVLTADRANVRRSQDCARDKEIVDHLKTAIDPCLMPARAVIKSGDEKRRIIFRSVPIG